MKQLLKKLLGETTPTAQQVIAVTKTYIRADLAPHLGVSHHDVPIRIELPLRGRRNLTWFVTLGEQKCMLRCYMPNEADRMQTHTSALRLMQEHDVPAPRLLHALEAPEKYGVLFAASEFAEGEGRGGQHVLNGEEVQCYAEAAARLHSIHNAKWGELSAPSNDDYFTAQMQAVDRYLQRAVKFNRLTAAQQQNMRAWFASSDAKFRGVNSYSLTHGDLHPNNVLFNGSSCAIVDTDEFSWNLAPLDVALIHDRGCKGNQDLVQQFDAAYLAALSPVDQAQHQKLYPWFAAFYRLRAVMRAVNLKDRKQDRITTPRALKGDLWDELLHTTLG